MARLRLEFSKQARLRLTRKSRVIARDVGQRMHFLAMGAHGKHDDGRKDYFVPLQEQGAVKWNDLDGEEDPKAIRDLVVDRDDTLSVSIEKAEYSAENFIVAGNAGVVIALLGLMQHAAKVRESTPIKIAIMFFLVSVVTIGFVKAGRIIRNYYIRGEWRKNSSEFFRNIISYEELMQRDADAWRNPKLMIYGGWAAYGCFIVGALFSILGLLRGIA